MAGRGTQGLHIGLEPFMLHIQKRRQTATRKSGLEQQAGGHGQEQGEAGCLVLQQRLARPRIPIPLLHSRDQKSVPPKPTGIRHYL